MDIRLRPIRFGFLVRPDDAENTLEIFRINTCLWGGMFNPIIPMFESVPIWLEDEGFHFENPKQMINDYLDFFEPDFLIEAEEGLADGFGFDPERVRKLSDMIEEPRGRNVHKYGLSVHGLYTELYAKEYQFQQRHKNPFVHVQPVDTAFTNFAASQFGSFPTEERLRYFEHNYKVIFNPKPVALDAASFSDIYQSGYNSALDIGCAKLQVGYNAPLLSTLFILDIQESKDIVDFWNLRAIHEHVRAVPIQWIEDLSPFCKEFIQDNYRRQPEDASGRKVGPILIFSRSLSDGNVEEIVSSFSFTNEDDDYTVQRWSPTIWYKLSSKVASPTRPTLAAERKITYLPFDENNPEIRFDPLFPDFVREYNLYRVANVVKLEDWSDEEYVARVRDRIDNDQIATVFPCNYKSPTVPKLQPEFLQEEQYILPITEGLVIFPYRENLSELWRLVDGSTAFKQWLTANQVPTILSDAGSTTEQIIQTLGGLGQGVFSLTYKGVVELLDKMSDRFTKSFHYEKFQGKICDAVDSEKLKDRIFETLVKQKAVELGVEIKCSECSKWGWYSVKQLDYSLICNFCFKQFDFPIINPTDKKHSKWAYRVVGPFARPDNAQGGYAAALSIRFFSEIVGGFDYAGVTWSSGQELTLNTNKKVEIDFMLWYRRRKKTYGNELSSFGNGLPNFGLDRPTETVFGEAKSNRRFEKKDVDKMKLLAEKFPGSILVFSTMRDGLSPSEIKRIKDLAKWGREYDPESKRTQAPVIVLTGTELFTSGSLTSSWKSKGGKHKDMAKRISHGKSNLRILANFTQHLYLDMEMLPYGPTDDQRKKEFNLQIEHIQRNKG